MKQRIVILLVAACCLGASAVRASSFAYAYDAAGRLVSVDSGGNKTLSYAYDPAGNLLQSSSPTPGLIVSVLSSTQLKISWPMSPGPFVLESAGTIGPGSSWTTVPGTPTLIGDQFVLTVPRNTATTFYRLQKN